MRRQIAPTLRLRDPSGRPLIIGYEIERDGHHWFCMGYTAAGVVRFARGGIEAFETSAADMGFAFS